jgi:4-amino-4-deoxy-L-arabinose transferase-like glycosyltransferase
VVAASHANDNDTGPMTNETAPSSEEGRKAERNARSERLNQIMWAYLCGGIVFLSFFVGFTATFIPLGFGVLGCVLAWQLRQKGENRHSTIAAAILVGGILIWLTLNWSWIGALIGH